MKRVSVVDSGAVGLCADLNNIAKRERQELRFAPLTTIELLFRQLEDETPDLILLHHHWDGLTITQIIDRISRSHDDARVVVFTGQTLNASELIECARSGVADYWPNRGALEPIVVFRKIDDYCSSPEWTIKKLRKPSGSQRQLIREAQVCQDGLADARKKIDTLSQEIASYKNQESVGFKKLAFSTLGFGLNSAILVAAIIVLNTKVPTMTIWTNITVASLLLAFFLFLEGKITRVFFKSNDVTAEISHGSAARPPEPPPSPKRGGPD